MGAPVVHFEIGCRDREKTAEFYRELFGWNTPPMGPAANELLPGADRGIRGHLTSLGHEPHQYVTVYVEVDDIAATLERVAALGGRKIVGPIPIPTGAFAWFADREGNTIGLLQPKSPA